jgi:WD40 repeat protein
VKIIALSPDGQVLASASGANTVQLWEVKTGTLQQTLEGHTKRVEAIAFSPDGRVLASTSCDRTVRLWDARTGALQQMLEFCSKKADNNLRHVWAKRVGAVAFSSNGQILAFTSQYDAVQLWVRTTV